MHRCYVEPDAWDQPATHTLGDEEAHHVADVLRLAPGANVIAFDGRGHTAPARIETVSRRGVTFSICAAPGFTPRPRPDITLLQAIPKGSHMDMIVEKTTEMGVACIQPLITERVIRRPSGSHEERWRRIAISAAKQCGTPWLPSILPMLDLAEALARIGAPDGFLVGSLEPDARPARQVLRPLAARGPATLVLLVGPEGDLSSAEYDAAKNAGAVPMSLGPLILRVETAAIVGVSMLRYECSAS
jgi:16S rRNA (uracil1498-N3)-methyltransferase